MSDPSTTTTSAGRRRRARRIQKRRRSIRFRALPLDEQQRRDQVAAEDEEEVDAEEAAGQPVDPRVVEEDGRDRDRAQAVEARAVGDVRCVGDWLRHFRQAA